MKQTTNFNEYNIVGDDSSLTINNSSGSLVSFTNGNLGIGTISPTEKFEVNEGFIRSTGSSIYHGFELARDTFPTYQIKHLDGGLTIYNSTDDRKEMTFKGNGRIGINNSNPIETLDVIGNIKADGILKLYDITDTQTIELNPDGDSYINSGNVGIGTSSPTEKLEIAGNIKLTDNTGPYLNLYRSDIVISQGDHLGSIVFGGGPEVYADSPLADSAIVIKAFASNIAASGNSPSKLIIQGISNNSNTLSDWVTFMNGNVGIGTTNSGTKLHISGDPALNAIGTQSLLRLERPYNAGVSFAQGADIAIGRGNTYPSTQMRFILDNGNNNPTNPQTTIMTLDSSGNVGIGTTLPTEKLDVDGNIKSSGYITGKRCGAAGYLASPVNITVTTANTYYPIGVFTVPVAEDFVVGTTYPNGLKYNGTIAQTFHITWNATIESTSNNVTATVDIQKNGVSIAMSKMGTYAKTGGEIYNLSGQCVVDLDTNDEVRFVVTADTNGEVLTFDYFAASIKEFFD